MRAVAKILIAATSVIALAACGGSNEGSSSAAKPAASAPAATAANETPAPAPAEEPAIAPAAVETMAVADAGPATHADAMMPAAEAAAPPAADATVVAAAATAVAAGEDYAAFTGNADAGKKVFVKCMACHSVTQGQNKVGPSLYGIVGRPAGSIAGFAYSAANKNSGITWTEQVMFEYLKNPQQYIKGTKMVFPGLPSGQDRADVIAYLKSVAQ